MQISFVSELAWPPLRIRRLKDSRLEGGVLPDPSQDLSSGPLSKRLGSFPPTLRNHTIAGMNVVYLICGSPLYQAYTPNSTREGKYRPRTLMFLIPEPHKPNDLAQQRPSAAHAVTAEERF